MFAAHTEDTYGGRALLKAESDDCRSGLFIPVIFFSFFQISANCSFKASRNSYDVYDVVGLTLLILLQK